MCPKETDGIAKSVDSDQTALLICLLELLSQYLEFLQ